MAVLALFRAMTTSQTSMVHGSDNRISSVGALGLIATAVGWVLVLWVLALLWSRWPNALLVDWAGIGFLIAALGISLFLAAASQEHPRRAARTVAVVVVVGLGFLLGFVVLGPVWAEWNETRIVGMASLGLLSSLPMFIALQIGLESVAKVHPMDRYRSTARTLASVYTVLMVISLVGLIPVLF
jgi:hypothetical protein